MTNYEVNKKFQVSNYCYTFNIIIYDFMIGDKTIELIN